ncbi:substrate-binding domain-containing protein [Bradyrhizobium sp. BR 1432]|uniref:substrate-binding domain-containing protein n=1 Tax=Bradyrhizobium sp. BR 1432 TaxID=3447966 RepID=UPI003EE4E86F
MHPSSTLSHSLHLPCVLVSRTVPGAKVDYVSPDHRGGMIKAVDHLIKLGHTRIGMIGSNENISTGRDRFAGYRQALAKHGIPLEPRRSSIRRRDARRRNGTRPPTAGFA